MYFFIKIARGPDFKANTRITSLKNVDVYPLLCGLLKITCNSNNGTINGFLNVLKPDSLEYVKTRLTFK